MLRRFNIKKSKPFSLKYTSTHSAVKALVDKIWENLPINKSKLVQLKKDCLVSILINLNSGYKNFKYIRYSRRKNYYAELPQRYKPLFFTYNIMTAIMDGLVSLKLIEQIPGFINLNDNTKLQTAVCAKSVFFKDLQAIKNNMIEEVPPLETIILKDRESDLKIDYKDNSKTRKMRKGIDSYNNLRQSTVFSMANLTPAMVKSNKEYFNQFAKNDYIESDTVIELRSSYVNRIFSDTFLAGGRFYNGFESNAKSDLRSKILINGNKTVEKDYSCLHINMLYNKKGLPLIGDAYAKVSGGNPNQRKLFKLIALVSLNSDSRDSFLKALRNEIRDNNLKNLFKKLTDKNLNIYLDKWVKAHHDIESYLFSDIGIKLQYEDSQFAAGIINHFTEKGVVVLVVHDSFIIEKKYESELVDKMIEVYMKKYKFTPTIK